MINSKILQEQRQTKLDEMTLITDKVKEEKRNLTEQETTQIDALDKEQEALQAQVESFERIEKVEGLTRAQSQRLVKEEALTGATRGEREKIQERHKAELGWMLHNSRHQRPEFWRAAERNGINVSSAELVMDWTPAREMRGTGNQIMGTPGAGGNLVPNDYSLFANIEWAMKMFGNVFEFADVIDTPGANLCPYDLIDDTSATGELTAEGSGMTVGDLTVAQNLLYAWKIDSKIIKVSWELGLSSVYDFSARLGQRLGERIGRGFNSLSIATGTGSANQQPKALLSETTSGGTSASPTVLGYTDITALFHSVDPAYREDPSTAFVFSDNVYQQLRNMLDGNLRPLLQSSLEGVASTLPITLLGKRVWINQAVPIYAANNKAMIFGALNRWKVRRVTGGADAGGVHVVRLDELYATSGLTGYFAWGLFDSGLADAGTRPIKHLVVHA